MTKAQSTYQSFISELSRDPSKLERLEDDVSKGKASGKVPKHYREVVAYFAANSRAWSKLLREVDKADKAQAKRKPKKPKKRPSKRLPKKPIRKPGKWVRVSGKLVFEPVVVAYTYRTEALVSFNAQYGKMSFAARSSRDIPEESASLQIFHTPFTKSKEVALQLFRDRIALMRAYGIVTFTEITFWKVSGDGPLKEKQWKLLGTYDEPEDVPGF